VNQIHAGIETLRSDKWPGLLRHVRPAPYGFFLHHEYIAQDTKAIGICSNNCTINRAGRDRGGCRKSVLNFAKKQFLKWNNSDQRRRSEYQEMALSSGPSSGLTLFALCLPFNGRGSAGMNPSSERRPANVWHTWQ
jgi:hypothetical protein